MQEKIKHLLCTVNQLDRAKNQLKTLNHNYNENEDIPTTASRRALEKGVKYNSPLEEANEHLLVPNNVYRQMLEETISYYEREAIKTNEEINKGFKL